MVRGWRWTFLLYFYFLVKILCRVTHANDKILIPNALLLLCKATSSAGNDCFEIMAWGVAVTVTCSRNATVAIKTKKPIQVKVWISSSVKKLIILNEGRHVSVAKQNLPEERASWKCFIPKPEIDQYLHRHHLSAKSCAPEVSRAAAASILRFIYILYLLVLLFTFCFFAGLFACFFVWWVLNTLPMIL